MAGPSESQFVGCLLGGLLGDICGAPVEAESPGYINKTFSSVDDILAQEKVEEILGHFWVVGHYTDDTQMSICVAEWLLHEQERSGKSLLARFAQAYHPARRYGSSAARLLEAFEDHSDNWEALARLSFPEGSFGNGAAMRVGPIGCLFCHDLGRLAEVARTSARVTHGHPRALRGAALQATAVAAAVNQVAVDDYVPMLRQTLTALGGCPQFENALAAIQEGLSAGRSAREMSEILGTGIDIAEAVPMAWYCYLANPDSFEKSVTDAIFVGGDTDTLAAMAGALSGARLGLEALPKRWLAKVREIQYTPGRIAELGRQLYRAHLALVG